MKRIIVPTPHHDVYAINAAEVAIHPTLAHALAEINGIQRDIDLCGLTSSDLNLLVLDAAMHLREVANYRLDDFYHNGYKVAMPFSPKDFFILEGFPEGGAITQLFIGDYDAYLFIVKIEFPDNRILYVVDTPDDISDFTYNVAWLVNNII